MIIQNKDFLKQNFKPKEGITIMLIASLVLLFLIISNILSLDNFDPAFIASKLRKGIKATQRNMEYYVRFVALIIIIGNTLVIGGFVGLIWWGINRKRYGLFFGVFWGIIFLVNATASPYYGISTTWSKITMIILHSILAIMMFAWTWNLWVLRTRIKQEMARRK